MKCPDCGSPMKDSLIETWCPICERLERLNEIADQFEDEEKTDPQWKQQDWKFI